MLKFKNVILFLTISLLLSACQSMTGMRMKDVMRVCDTGQDIDFYIDCIKTTYNASGTRPDDPITAHFYAKLDVVAEKYRSKIITPASAKLMIHDAYESTIQAANERRQRSAERASDNFIRDQNRETERRSKEMDALNKQSQDFNRETRKQICQSRGDRYCD
jgi:hypothetical protein